MFVYVLDAVFWTSKRNIEEKRNLVDNLSYLLNKMPYISYTLALFFPLKVAIALCKNLKK